MQNALYEACSQFGLVYEVQVFPGIKSSRAPQKQSDGSMSYYAFVKFYSYYAAQKAKVTLSKNLKIGSQICKVRHRHTTDAHTHTHTHTHT